MLVVDLHPPPAPPLCVVKKALYLYCSRKMQNQTNFNCQTLFLDQNKAQLKIIQHFDDIHTLSKVCEKNNRMMYSTTSG